VPFLIVETIAFVQIALGLFGDLASEARDRIASIEGTLELRRQQLQAAIEAQSDKVDVYKRTVQSLEDAIGGIRLEAQQLEDQGIWIAAGGFALLLIDQGGAGDRCQHGAGTPLLRLAVRPVHPGGHAGALHRAECGVRRTDRGSRHAALCLPRVLSGAGRLPHRSRHPAHRHQVGRGVLQLRGDQWRGVVRLHYLGIRLLLDALEMIFVRTPWVVIASFIILLTWLSAGVRTAIYSGAFLGYMGLLGFWEKAMTTLALLGTAACLSILIGIPLGMFCARRPRFYSFIQPIMDFMQTMPAFVFMIPVIAFFGTGKPAAVVTTMIFGGTPVVRLTVLGLRGVPEHVREAAISFGASKWYLLTRVDLPLASPSIRAGINQTIMLSLAMVVVASLIGAKGLGEDVLEALQYANVGQGILAGFAILFCAMILDRIVQGARK
jgi:glycine betaine/proline transport system permease protein